MKKSKHGQAVRFVRRFDCYHYKECLSEQARQNKIRNFCHGCEHYKRVEFRIGGFITEEAFKPFYDLWRAVFESS